jgi:hypothetical protein
MSSSNVLGSGRKPSAALTTRISCTLATVTICGPIRSAAVASGYLRSAKARRDAQPGAVLPDGDAALHDQVNRRQICTT